MSNKKTPKTIVKTLTLPDGKRKYFYGRTVADAERKRQKYKEELAGGLIPDDDTTFGEIAKVWLDKYKAPYLRPSSLANLRCQVNGHLMKYLAPVKVRDITPLICQSVLAEAVKKEYTHVGQIQSYLRDILGVAVELGCISHSPLQVKRNLPSAKKKRGEKEILPDRLYRDILDGLEPFSLEQIYLTVGMETGMRRGEVLALEWKNIDMARRTIHVEQQLSVEDGKYKLVPYTKTANGIRTLPIPPNLYALLETLGDAHGYAGFVLRWRGGHLTRSIADTVWEHIREVCAKHDPEFAKNFTSHTLRHTYVTKLVESGLDVKAVQTLSGHANISTTLGVYTHFDRANRQEDAFHQVQKLFSTNELDPRNNVIKFPRSV